MNEDSKVLWENQFIHLMNKMESLESLPLPSRTKDQQNELNKLRKKYHKKKSKYPHLSRPLLSKAEQRAKQLKRAQKMIRNKLNETKGTVKTENVNSVPACFGSGTLYSPLVKFYFTAACPQLGIEAGSEPCLGGRPAFLASQQGFTCRYIRVIVMAIKNACKGSNKN